MKNEGIMYAVLKKYGLYNKRNDYIDLCYIGYTKAINSYDDKKGSLHNYIYNCVENELLTELRKERAIKRQRMECSADQIYDSCGLGIYDMVADDVDLETDLIKKDDKLLLYKAILKLDDNEQFIINGLFDLLDKNYTPAELCKQLNISSSQMNKIKNGALLKLKKMLGDIK